MWIRKPFSFEALWFRPIPTQFDPLFVLSSLFLAQRCLWICHGSAEFALHRSEGSSSAAQAALGRRSSKSAKGKSLPWLWGKKGGSRLLIEIASRLAHFLIRPGKCRCVWRRVACQKTISSLQAHVDFCVKKRMGIYIWDSINKEGCHHCGSWFRTDLRIQNHSKTKEGLINHYKLQ